MVEADAASRNRCLHIVPVMSQLLLQRHDKLTSSRFTEASQDRTLSPENLLNIPPLIVS